MTKYFQTIHELKAEHDAEQRLSAAALASLAGREHIAKLAKADGEHTFAREVLAGCWDHRDDVKNAIARAAIAKATGEA